VNFLLRGLPAERLSVEYELFFVITHQTKIDSVYTSSTKTPIKFIEPQGGFGFRQLCMEATRQASGEYILFVNSPIRYEQVVEAIQQLEISGTDIEAPKEKEYIIVKKAALTKNPDLLRLLQEQRKQNDRWSINKLIHLLTDSAACVLDVFFTANRNRPLLDNGIKHIDLTRTDDCNIYKLLFLKSIKGYLDSGLEFNSEQQCIAFYCKVTLPTSPCLLSQTARRIEQAQVVEVMEVPWFVGIMLSLPHLNDSHSLVRHAPTELQQSAAILVSVYNEVTCTELCFEAVRKSTNFPYYLIAINNSTIDMQDFKRSMLRKGLIDEWFDSGCTSHSDGPQKSLARVKTFRYITTLDSDAIVLKKAWLTEFIEQLNCENAAMLYGHRQRTHRIEI
jgi:hypothetical protein